MAYQISPVQFEELIGLAYTGATEEPPWHEFLDKICHLFGLRAAAITLFEPENERNSRYIIVAEPGDTTDWSAIEREYYARGVGKESGLSAVKPGQVVSLRTRDLEGPYRSFLESHRIAHSLRAGLAGCAGAKGWLELIRSKPENPFERRDMNYCQRLLPHLDRALNMYTTMMERETERSYHNEAIDHLSVGFALLDGNACIMHLNHTIAEIISSSAKRGCEIQMRNNQLVIADPKKNREMESSLRLAIHQSQEENSGWEGEVVRLDSPKRGFIGMLIKHVPRTACLQGAHTPYAPHAVIYMTDTEQNPRALHGHDMISLELISRLLQLTRREAKLALLLANSVSLQEAAVAMNISEGTVRNYSKRIYQKFGVHRQNDLVKIVNRCLALLR